MVVEIHIQEYTRERLISDIKDLRKTLKELEVTLERSTDEWLNIHEKQVSAIKGVLEWKSQIVVYNS